MTSAEIVIEFVKGRPALELEVRREMDHGIRAPEMRPWIARDLIIEAMQDGVSDEEREKLDRMRGNGAVAWDEVARAFGG